MERIRGTAAMRRWIGQRFDHLVKFDHRSRPTMRDDQGPRLRMLRANMDEMDVEPVDLGGELAEPIEPRLALPRLVALAPRAKPRLINGLGRFFRDVARAKARRRRYGAKQCPGKPGISGLLGVRSTRQEKTTSDAILSKTS